MALHDYRRAIDQHDGGFIAVEITTLGHIALHVEDADSEWATVKLDKATAGLVLDALAGAIRELEGLA